MADEPFRLKAAGCGCFVHHAGDAPCQCDREPVVVGLVMIGEPSQRRTLWRGFACDDHVGELLAARALLPRDHALRAHRRDAWHTQLAGRRWTGSPGQPLAWGREAAELLARAQAWAARHPR